MQRGLLCSQQNCPIDRTSAADASTAACRSAWPLRHVPRCEAKWAAPEGFSRQSGLTSGTRQGSTAFRVSALILPSGRPWSLPLSNALRVGGLPSSEVFTVPSFRLYPTKTLFPQTPRPFPPSSGRDWKLRLLLRSHPHPQSHLSPAAPGSSSTWLPHPIHSRTKGCDYEWDTSYPENSPEG